VIAGNKAAAFLALFPFLWTAVSCAQAPAGDARSGKRAQRTTRPKQALRIDEKGRRVLAPGRVARQEVYKQTKGMVEYVACAPGGKGYESIFICTVDPLALYEGLKRIGLKAGKPAYEDDDGNMHLPKGDRLRLHVEWTVGGKERRAPIENFILDVKTGRPMRTVEWVFTGSSKGWDPETEKDVLEVAINKNLISLHHEDRSVLVQNPLKDAQESHRYKAYLKALPKAGTPVTLVFEAVEARSQAPASGTRRIHALLSGRVQGVGFRAFTRRQARRLKIRGWVRNLPTGEVELVAEGPGKAIKAFEQKIRRGPRGARVDQVRFLESEEGRGRKALPAFEVRPTPRGKAKSRP